MPARWASSSTASTNESGSYLDQEIDGVAVGPAAEAVIGLLLGADREGGGLLGVEGAAGLEVSRPALFSGDPIADQIDDIGTGEDGFLELAVDSAGHARKASRAAGERSSVGISAREPRLTRALTAPMSARPWTWGLSTAMTLPMSLMAAAPVSAMAAATSAAISASREGRGQIGLDDLDLELLDIREVLTARRAILGDGVAALLDHLVEHREDLGVVELDPLVHLALLDWPRGSGGSRRAGSCRPPSWRPSCRTGSGP